MSATNKRIGDILCEYRRLKAAIRENRAEMIMVAVDVLGIGQNEAMKIPLDVLLDGYLIGQGVHKNNRIANESSEAA